MTRVFILLLVMAGTCCAGLRETRDELIARYGQPRGPSFSGKEAGEPLSEEVLAFVVPSSRGEGRHMAILAYLSGGNCEAIRYNPNDYDRFSDSELELLKQENGEGRDWVKQEGPMPKGVDDMFVTRTPEMNAGSVLEVLQGRLIVYFATAPFFVKHMRGSSEPKGP